MCTSRSECHSLERPVSRCFTPSSLRGMKLVRSATVSIPCPHTLACLLCSLPSSMEEQVLLLLSFLATRPPSARLGPDESWSGRVLWIPCYVCGLSWFVGIDDLWTASACRTIGFGANVRWIVRLVLVDVVPEHQASLALLFLRFGDWLCGSGLNLIGLRLKDTWFSFLLCRLYTAFFQCSLVFRCNGWSALYPLGFPCNRWGVISGWVRALILAQASSSVAWALTFLIFSWVLLFSAASTRRGADDVVFATTETRKPWGVGLLRLLRISVLRKFQRCCGHWKFQIQFLCLRDAESFL